MNLMYEDLARSHMAERVAQAREDRRSVQMRRAQRLARRAERAARRAERVQEQQRLVVARSM